MIRRFFLPMLLVAGIMGVISFSEYVFAYRNVAYGIILSLALVALLYTFLSARRAEDDLASSVESIALVPMYMLFTSSLPWFFIHQNFLLPAVYSCILGLCWLHVYQKQIDLRQIFGAVPRADKIIRFAAAGILIGASLGFIEYLVLRPAPAHAHISAAEIGLNLVYMLFFVGLGEELLFRGLIQRDLSRLFGWQWGLLLASVLFGIMHLTWRSAPELLFVFVAGLILGALYLKTRNLFVSILAHGVNNVMLVAVYPYMIVKFFG